MTIIKTDKKLVCNNNLIAVCEKNKVYYIDDVYTDRRTYNAFLVFAKNREKQKLNAIDFEDIFEYIK